MNKFILVHNFNSEDFSIHKLSELLFVSMKNQKIDDLVLFMPSMGRATEDFVMGLFNVSDMCGPDFCAHIFLEEEDYSNLPFNFFVMVHERNPNVRFHSKEDAIYIGEHYFKWLDLSNNFALEEFAIFPDDKAKGIKKTYVVSSKKEEVFLKHVSKKINYISSGDTQVLSRKYARDSKNRKTLLEEEKLSNVYPLEYLFTDNNNDLKVNKKEELSGLVLKLTPQKKNKKGN